MSSKLIDISTFCKKSRRIRENFIRCLLAYGTKQEIENSISVISAYVLENALYSDDICNLFIHRCNEYIAVAYRAYSLLITCGAEEDDNQLYGIIYNHLVNHNFNTTIDELKEHRPFYRWLVMNDKDITKIV
jgi:hypothetical protein